MAVLPLSPGIKAQVLIGGNPATEYPDFDEIEVEHENPSVVLHQKERTVSTYIECEADALFSLQFTAGQPDADKKMKCSHLAFNVTIDGNKAGVIRCSRKDFKRAESEGKPMVDWTGVLAVVKAQPGGKGRVQAMNFRFARIAVDSNSTTSDANIKRYKQRMQKVGLIEVKVYREGYGKKGGGFETSPENFLKPQDTKKVPERALKGPQAKSDCTLLGKATRAFKGPDHWGYAPKKDGEDYPLGIFRFMYRSREALRALHVIQHTPEPSVSRESTPNPSISREQTPDPDHVVGEDGLTPYQRREIEEELRVEREQKIAKMKAKAAESKKRKRSAAAVKIKKERMDEERRVSKKARKYNGNSKEIVDLTSEVEDDSLFMPQ